jgi:MYXO-CTERM domain-containing protein
VSSSGDDGGCSVKAPGGRTPSVLSPSALWLTALLGLVLLRRKRALS